MKPNQVYKISHKALKTPGRTYIFLKKDEKIGQYVFTNGPKWFTIKLSNRNKYSIRRVK
jgi:hypothetical protein